MNSLPFKQSSASNLRNRILVAMGLLAWSFLAQAESTIHTLKLIPQHGDNIVMGELVSSEIQVSVESDFKLDTANLPQAGSAVNDFLEIHETAWSQQERPSETLYTIKLTYQVFKAVRGVEDLEIPALELRFSHNEELVEAQAPAWKLSITPLIPPQTPDEAVEIKADLPTPEYSPENHWHRLFMLLVGLATMGIYALWYLGLPPFKFYTPPFVCAATGLKKLRKKPDLVKWQQGIKLIHVGLNETAGCALFINQLADFLAQRPQYAGLKSELEQFFALSDRLFFAGATALPPDYPWSRLEALCQALALVEKQP